MQALLKIAVRPNAPPAGQPADDDELQIVGVARSYDRDQEIYGEGDPADLVYKVVTGAVRSVRLLVDGRRQISDFYLPGDVFGLGLEIERRSSAEAVGEVTAIAVRRSALASDAANASRLWRHAVCELQRSQDHALTLGRRAASERVASLLLDLADRAGTRAAVELPMSRQDMADYLGLTIETVSRSLAHLEGRGVIEARCCRHVRLLDRERLVEMCE